MFWAVFSVFATALLVLGLNAFGSAKGKIHRKRINVQLHKIIEASVLPHIRKKIFKLDLK